MLVLDDVQYTYQRELFRFELSIECGQIVSLMGPSGAGKSTLLALVAGFIHPDQGDIRVDGESIVRKEPYQRPFSMLFQEHNLFSHLSVRDNIGLGSRTPILPSMNAAYQPQITIHCKLR